MFCDETNITVEAGKGGDGLMSLKRLKYNAKGGPDGGDGGNGGSIIFEGNQNINTLGDLNTRKYLAAEEGGTGGKNNKHGKNGEHLVIEVPLGTKIYKDDRDKKLLFDITSHGMQVIAARGGRGGYGNAHFTSSVRQTPRFAEKGEPGVKLDLTLELQMIADVGIIGYPSAGKSTLVSVISSAKPKIGDYPFTTLVPNLGVIEMKRFGGNADQNFVVADVPGLIKGAHEGKGVGDKFLRHIKRTAVLLHLIDISRDDFVESFEVINNELMLFDPKMMQRDQLVVLNKIDVFDEKEIEKRHKQFLKKYPFLEGKLLLISAAANQGLKELVFALREKIDLVKPEVEEIPKDVDAATEFKVFRPHLDDSQRVTVEYVGEAQYLDPYTDKEETFKQFRVSGNRVEQIVIMSDLDNDEALARVYDVLHKKKVAKELARLGANPGDHLLIGDDDIEWVG